MKVLFSAVLFFLLSVSQAGSVVSNLDMGGESPKDESFVTVEEADVALPEEGVKLREITESQEIAEDVARKLAAAERERKRQRELAELKERERQIEEDRERERALALQREKEREAIRQREIAAAKERERQREALLQREAEAEQERQRQREMLLQREAALQEEQTRQQTLLKQRQKARADELEADRERRREAEREAERERQRQRELAAAKLGNEVAEEEPEKSVYVSREREPEPFYKYVARNVKIFKTGQTKSYDQYGNEVTDGSIKDDGFYRKGESRIFRRDHTAAIVVDHVNGLMWQDDEAAATKRLSWSEAMVYCQYLDFGGYNDWTLPTVDELLSLVQKEHFDPAIEPLFEHSDSKFYWSSTIGLSQQHYAWGVNFKDGFDYWNDKLKTFNVRCVRDGAY